MSVKQHKGDNFPKPYLNVKHNASLLGKISFVGLHHLVEILVHHMHQRDIQDVTSLEFIDGRKAMIDFFKSSKPARVSIMVDKYHVYVEDQCLMHDEKDHKTYFRIHKN